MESSGKQSYIWSCGMASPSWLPVHYRECYQPQGFHILGQDQDQAGMATIDGSSYRSRKWRQVLKSLLQREGRRLRRKKSIISCHSPKATNMNFGYDAVSYSKNFDDGMLDEDYYCSTTATCSIKHDHAS